MSLRLYDTLTGEKRAFESVHPGKAGMYVCGMTVQDKPHVGHIRSSIVGDTLRQGRAHVSRSDDGDFPVHDSSRERARVVRPVGFRGSR